MKLRPWQGLLAEPWWLLPSWDSREPTVSLANCSTVANPLHLFHLNLNSPLTFAPFSLLLYLLPISRSLDNYSFSLVNSQKPPSAFLSTLIV